MTLNDIEWINFKGLYPSGSRNTLKTFKKTATDGNLLILISITHFHHISIIHQNEFKEERVMASRKINTFLPKAQICIDKILNPVGGSKDWKKDRKANIGKRKLSKEEQRVREISHKCPWGFRTGKLGKLVVLTKREVQGSIFKFWGA